jgi:hypothetical protein
VARALSFLANPAKRCSIVRAMMARSTALFGFVLVGTGTLLPWFRWERVIGGREAIFEESGVDMADRGETILVFAVVGGIVVWFATHPTTLIIPVLTAVMALVVVLYSYNTPPTPIDDKEAVEGFYITLAGTMIALAASAARLLEALGWGLSPGGTKRIDPGR